MKVLINGSGKVYKVGGTALGVASEPTERTSGHVITANSQPVLDSGKVLQFGPNNYLCFTAQQANSTVAMSKTGSPNSINLQTSRDKITWTTFTPGSTSITLSAVGDKVYFKGNNSGINKDDSNYYNFSFTGRIAASGNCNSIINFAETVGTFCFGRLFFNCTVLTSMPELPAVSLGYNCYAHMFRGCTSLTSVNILPALVAAERCYRCMFYGCTSLTTMPQLPATTLYANCYDGMFQGCTSLSTVTALPANILANNCYSYMFYNCGSLTAAPALPAMQLAQYCYQYMFDSCRGLTTTPKLPAVTLANYCYKNMFNSCTSLTTVSQISAEKMAPYGCQFMFYGCTSLTTVSSLPATSLSSNCYRGMFYGCTSLNTVPVLPATTLQSECYLNMFNGCASLYVSDTSGSGYNKAWRIPTSGTFTNTYSQANMFTSCRGTRSSNNMAGAAGNSYTYYTQNSPV